MKLYIILLFFCITGLTYGQLNFVLSPPIIEMTISQNSQKEFNIYLQNNNSKNCNITTHIKGLTLSDTGVPIPIQDENEYSCADWISLEPEQFELEAGKDIVVTGQIKVPRNTKGGKFAVILFEPESKLQEQSMNVQISGQLGTIIMLNNIYQQTKKAQIKNCNVIVDTSEYKFLLVLENTGDTYFKAKGDVLIIDRTNTIYDRISLESGTGTILPEGSRIFYAHWSNKKYLIPGEYKALFRMNYPGNYQNLECEKSFTIKVQ